MTGFRGTAAMATVAAATLALTACSSETTTSDTLRYGLSSAPSCADPAQASTNQTVNVARQVVDSLVDQNPGTGEITGWLAQQYAISDDGRSFTFTLRPDVTFSDGTPLTSTVVKQNFDALTTQASSTRTLQASGFLLGYDRTDTPDPHTAVVHFKQPNVQFLQAAATTQLGILAAATVSKTFDERCRGETVIGSGPYTYQAWDQNRSITLAARQNYRWAPEIGFSPEVRYRTVEFSVVPESGVRSGSISGGQLDAIADPQPQDRAALESVGARFVSRPNPGLPYILQANLSRGVLADPVVRQAVSSSLNRQVLVDTALGAGFRPATSILASTTPGYRADPGLAFDPGAARAGLDRAGWQVGPDGIRTRAGQRLSFDVIYSPEFYANKPILELAQQQLRDSGIDMTITALSNDDFLTRRADGRFDAVYYNVTRADPDILRSRIGVQGTNFSRRAVDPATDPLLEAQAGIADRRERLALVDRIQSRLLSVDYAIPIVELSQVAAVAPGYPGVGFDASGVLRLQFDEETAR